MKGPSSSVYHVTLQELYGLGKFGIKLGLANITTLLQRLNDPHRQWLSIHIAGSNGKGSVAALLAAALQAAGHCVGLYTSPHLVDFEERIRVNGRPISRQAVVHLWRQIRPWVRKLRATYFEAVTAMAFEHFRAKKIDVAVVEVGLGGRLDATNVLQPHLSVITNISREHTRWLGTRLEQIAREKAGIVKGGAPVVCAETRKTPLGVIRGICRRNQASFHLVDEEMSWEIMKADLAGTVLLVRSVGENFGKLHLGLAGRHQVRNGLAALLSLQVLRSIGWNIPIEAMIGGLRDVHWPGRLQMVREHPLVLLDVAHNPAGTKALVTALREFLPDKKICFVFGVQEDKEHGIMIRHLAPLAEKMFLTQAQWKGAEDPKELAREAKGAGVSFHVKHRVDDAVAFTLQQANAQDVVCITGSHFVVGEAMVALDVRP
jgi:dihydrofolate synthase/folylpolyglutamate synthase